MREGSAERKEQGDERRVFREEEQGDGGRVCREERTGRTQEQNPNSQEQKQTLITNEPENKQLYTLEKKHNHPAPYKPSLSGSRCPQDSFYQHIPDQQARLSRVHVTQPWSCPSPALLNEVSGPRGLLGSVSPASSPRNLGSPLVAPPQPYSPGSRQPQVSLVTHFHPVATPVCEAVDAEAVHELHDDPPPRGRL